MALPMWGVNVEQKPVGLAEMAQCVADIAADAFDLDAARVLEGRQVYPGTLIDRRVYVLEKTAKLLDLIRNTPALVAAVQKAAKTAHEKELKREKVR